MNDRVGWNIASHAGVFRGARISSPPTNASLKLPLKRLRGRLDGIALEFKISKSVGSNIVCYYSRF